MQIEREILGAMIFNPVAIDDAAAKLTSSHFTDQRHHHIFQALCRLRDQGQPADIVTITNDLKSSKTLESAGGIAYVGGLHDMETIGSHYSDHITILQESHDRRLLADVASQIASGVQDNHSPSEIAERADTSLQAMSTDSRREMIPIAELIRPAVHTVQVINESNTPVTGLPLGYAELDDILGGFQPSDLIILAARPSAGKTSLCLNIAANAMSDNKKIAIFSLEMSAEQLTTRLLSSESRVGASKLRRGGMKEDDWGLLTSAAEWLDKSSAWIGDSPAMTVAEIRRKSRSLAARNGLDLIIIDYLQLFHGEGEEYTRVSEASRQLKDLAKELKVPVLCLSQLSRNLESRSDKRPMLSDLRSSGQIEQDADVVMFIYRPVIYSSNAPDDLAEIIIAKHRNGPTGATRLSWSQGITRFDDPTQLQKEGWKDHSGEFLATQ